MSCDRCGGFLLTQESPDISNTIERSCIVCGGLKFYDKNKDAEAQRWVLIDLMKSTGLA